MDTSTIEVRSPYSGDVVGRVPKGGRAEARLALDAAARVPRDPLSALFLAGLEEEAGLPPGWLTVVAGSASEIGDELVGDDRVKLITFTGSGEVGWGIAERAHRKRVKLELGNATPAIVCADAPAGTAEKLAANAFSFAGQSCISVQRVYVMADVWDEFVPAFVAKVESLKVGDPSAEETDVGPVSSE